MWLEHCIFFTNHVADNVTYHSSLTIVVIVCWQVPSASLCNAILGSRSRVCSMSSWLLDGGAASARRAAEQELCRIARSNVPVLEGVLADGEDVDDMDDSTRKQVHDLHSNIYGPLKTESTHRRLSHVFMCIEAMKGSRLCDAQKYFNEHMWPTLKEVPDDNNFQEFWHGCASSWLRDAVETLRDVAEAGIVPLAPLLPGPVPVPQPPVAPPPSQEITLPIAHPGYHIDGTDYILERFQTTVEKARPEEVSVETGTYEDVFEEALKYANSPEGQAFITGADLNHWKISLAGPLSDAQEQLIRLQSAEAARMVWHTGSHAGKPPKKERELKKAIAAREIRLYVVADAMAAQEAKLSEMFSIQPWFGDWRLVDVITCNFSVTFLKCIGSSASCCTNQWVSSEGSGRSLSCRSTSCMSQ